MSTLCERMFSAGSLRDWLSALTDGGSSGRVHPVLRVERLPRSAWPLLMAAVSRSAAKQGRSMLALTQGPTRFIGDLRP